MDRLRLAGRELPRRVEARLAVRAERTGRRLRVERDGREVGLGAGGDAGERPAAAGHARREPRRAAPAGEPEGRLGERHRHSRRGLADRPVPRSHALRVVVVRLEQRLLLVPTATIAARAAIRWGERFQLGVVERAGGVEAAHDLGGRGRWDRRDRARRAVAAATASSHTRSVRVTSPKSITPQGMSRPARSRRPTTFQSVTSQCTIWRRQAGQEALDGAGCGLRRRPATSSRLRGSSTCGRERLDDRADVTGIPLQRTVGGPRARTPRASARHARRSRRGSAGRAPRGEPASTRGSPSMKVDEPEEVGHPVALDGDQLATVERRAGHGHLERDALREVRHRAVLEVELGLAEGGVRDLEDEPRGPGVDEHVLILVGSQLGDAPLDAEAIARQPPARPPGRSAGSAAHARRS